VAPQREFSFKGKRFVVFSGVYEPAEDSLLLAESLEVRKGDEVLDVGTGCGIQAILASERAGRVVATDASPLAVENARHNAALNGADVDVRVGDLFEPVRGERFDLIVFNPPYLPCEGEDASWCGGRSGREVTNRFLDEVASHLKPGGRVLLVQSSLSGIEETLERLRGLGMSAEIVAEGAFFFERIAVIRAELRPQVLRAER